MRTRPRAGRPRRAPPKTLPLVTVLILTVVAVPVAQGQDIIKKAKKALEKTEVGKQVNAAALEAQMVAASYIDLEDWELDVVPVGQLSFGLSGVDLLDGVGLRLHAYLYNPNLEDVAVPPPNPDLFRLVDDRGRPLVLASGPSVENVEAGAEIVVPALERVNLTLLYGHAPDAPCQAILKVGKLGLIQGIPAHSAAAGHRGGEGDVWSGEPAPEDDPYEADEWEGGEGDPSDPAELNWIRYTVSGSTGAMENDVGTVSCSTTPDGRFLLDSPGSWGIRLEAQAQELGQHAADLSLTPPADRGGASGQASGSATLSLDDIREGPGGQWILSGTVSAAGLASAGGGALGLEAEFSCPVR